MAGWLFYVTKMFMTEGHNMSFPSCFQNRGAVIFQLGYI